MSLLSKSETIPVITSADSKLFDASTLKLNTSSESMSPSKIATPATANSPKTPINEINLNKFLILSNPSSAIGSVCSRSSSSNSNSSQPIDIDLHSSMPSNHDDDEHRRLLKENLSHLLTPESSPNTGIESMFSFQSKFDVFNRVL